MGKLHSGIFMNNFDRNYILVIILQVNSKRMHTIISKYALLLTLKGISKLKKY